MLINGIAKRLPYADHIVALSNDGKIAEQGKFEYLNLTGGYVSSFSLSQPEWNYTLDDNEVGKESAIEYTYCPSSSNVTTESIEAEASRRTGDVAIYLYYINSIGWLPTIIFIVTITSFVFCVSFPSLPTLSRFP